MVAIEERERTAAALALIGRANRDEATRRG
jgi:hypothetical protein